MKKVIIFAAGFFILIAGVAVFMFTGDKNNSYTVQGGGKKEVLSRETSETTRNKKEVEEKDEPKRKLLVIDNTKHTPPPVVKKEEEKPPVRKTKNDYEFKNKPQVRKSYLPLVVKASGSLKKDKQVIKSKNWMPSHRLIPCRLVNTVETRNVVSPIIAIVTEDVMHHGEVVIPAFTEIFGTIGGKRDGERVGAARTWRLVFNDGKNNGKELSINGTVLHRADKDDNPEKKITEMSAGFVGQRLERYPDEMKQIMTLSAFQAGVEALKDQSTNAFGQEIDNGSVKNAGLEAVAKPAQLWVDRQLARLDEDPFFLRVPGGTGFYIFTGDPVDRANAKKGQIVDKEATTEANAIGR